MARPAKPEAIAAIATAPGRGGIGVVRISGPSLFVFARQISGIEPKPRHAHFTRFLTADGSEIDEGLLLYFPAPHSFTGEDVIELQGHGGPVVLQMLLSRCLELGARLAHPGEFTQRAFLNERLDLAQAEAVADLIEASSEAAARSALRSLSGRFSQEVGELRERMIELRMLVEATLDFPEEELDFLAEAKALERIAEVRTALEGMLDRARQGSLLRQGMAVVLVGVPNVGKSSLLNQLAGEDRAIVTEVAGTTRDALRELIHIEGIPVHVIDTAGLRETSDVVERIGIERTWQEIARASVILRLVDARQPEAPHEDAEIDRRMPAGIPRLVVRNKIDLAGLAPGVDQVGDVTRISVSARSGAGVELVRGELLRLAGWHSHSEDVVLARERHLDALGVAAAHLESAHTGASALELMAEDLRLAHEALGQITGEFTADDLLGEIFSRFCIGK